MIAKNCTIRLHNCLVKGSTSALFFTPKGGAKEGASAFPNTALQGSLPCLTLIVVLRVSMCISAAINWKLLRQHFSQSLTQVWSKHSQATVPAIALPACPLRPAHPATGVPGQLLQSSTSPATDRLSALYPLGNPTCCCTSQHWLLGSL